MSCRVKPLFIQSFSLLALLFACALSHANETEIPGFTEAIQKVEVAAPESGLLDLLNVKEGDYIEKGSLVGRLDNEIQKAQMEIALHMANAKGDLTRVESELSTKKSILEHFERLSTEGFAQQKEIIRARMDFEIAKANLLSRKEKGIEFDKRLKLAKIQLNRREIRAPISGKVMAKHRNVGEFVSVTQPKIITLVQTNLVRGKFQIRLRDSGYFNVGDSVDVKVNGTKYSGTVESIGIEATSETVPVCVSIKNENSTIMFGQRCTLVVPAGELTSVDD